MPLRNPPTLRRLSVFNDEYELEWINNLSDWTPLTHLSLDIPCTLHDWFSLICPIPNLQWCHIYIHLMGEDTTNYIQPTKIVLPRLSNLFLHCMSAYNELRVSCPSRSAHLRRKYMAGFTRSCGNPCLIEVRTSNFKAHAGIEPSTLRGRL